MSYTILGILSSLASAASWAIGSIMFKKIGEQMNAFGITLLKSILATFFLGIVYILQGFEPLMPQNILMLAVSGFIGISIGDTLFFASLQHLGPKVQLSFYMLGQVITALLGILILRELPFLAQWIGIVVTLLGVTVVLWQKFFSSPGKQKTVYRGIVLGLLSMFCFSFSLILAKQAMFTVSSMTAVFIRMAAGAFGMLVYGLITQKVKNWLQPFSNIRFIGYFILSVLIITFGGFWLSMYAVATIDVVLASVLGTTEPLFVLPLAYFFMHEKITTVEVVGVICTVIGVIIIMIGSGPGF